MLLLLLSMPAFAGPTNAESCLSCCRDSGLASCSTELLVHGEASKSYKEGDGYRSEGLYVVSCDGRGFFDDGRTAVFASAPAWGEAAKQSSAQWACFAEACQLPTNLCFDAEAGKVTVCSTGAGPAGAAFRAAPAPRGATAVNRPTPAATTPTGTTTVLVGGRALVVERAEASSGGPPAPMPAPPAPAAAPIVVAQPAPPVAVAAPAIPKKPPTPLFEDEDDLFADMEGVVAPPVPSASVSPTPPAPTPLPPATPALAPMAPDALAQLTAGLPKDPPAQCEAPMEALRGEARKQVMAGDDLRLAKDAGAAVQKYRAALSMDACNAYAWLGLGESAIALGRPDIAIRALKNTTTLLPQHYGAWAALGAAFEAIAQPDLAVSAYRKAVALKPGLDGATAGLARLGAQ